MTRAELLYAAAAFGANMLGAVALTSRSRSVRALDAVLAFSAGFMLSVACVDLLPEAIARHGAQAGIVALASYLLVHLTQHTLGQHFHFGEETHAVSGVVSTAALVGLLMHTFVDGVAVTSGLLVSGLVGTLVFMGVVLHKVPEGLAISSLFLASGRGRRAALLAAAALGTSTVIGVIVTAQVPWLRENGLAVAAGVTLYVAASNLVPEFQSKGGWRLPASFVAGCGVYFLARTLGGG
ncbi:MAG: zinc/iron permease [Gemmatimonadetes bacterium]|nr:zinc/iron permease [Gemmatimonadota bacterium]